MSRFRPLSRRAAFLALALFASILSCGREVTGPGGRGALVQLSFAPTFASVTQSPSEPMLSVGALVPFTKVRIELRRVDNSIAAEQVVDFPANAEELPLSLSVRLGAAAVNGAEPLTAYLRYINAAGDTVFAGGPISVTARAGSQGQQEPPVEVPVVPTVPGALFDRVEITPDSATGLSGQTLVFSASGFDAQDVLVPNAIIGFISRDPALVAVPNLASGSVNLVGVRGSTWLVAQSLTGVRDSAFITVNPVPSTLAKVTGDLQSVMAGELFADPLRVRVTAADGQAVAGWPVSFAVTLGGGTVTVTDTITDANGYAQTEWIAGADAGPGSVTVSVGSSNLSTVFAGTQLSTDATALSFLTQPTDIRAGDTLPTITIAVLDGAGAPASEFNGELTLTLVGGAGAQLIGTTTVNAVAGIASFSGLTVDRAGTDLRLSISLDQLPPAQSVAFDVSAAPPRTITVLSGADQSAPPSTELADSIRVRVTDVFGYAVAGATVRFTVLQGGGSVSSDSVVTDADGRAAASWTVGTGGVQRLRASVGQFAQTVEATVIISGGGTVELFSGFDYLDLRAGGSRLVPIYLTNPSATPVDVQLSVSAEAEGAFAWESSSVTIPAGVTRLDVRLNGIEVGEGWAVMRSEFGDDSLIVVVDTATVVFVNTGFYLTFAAGDTVRTHIRLQEPAPEGGLNAIVRSLNPSIVLVAPGTGASLPSSDCIEHSCGLGGSMLMAPVGEMSLKAPAADSAVIFIPEGQVFGEVVLLVASGSFDGEEVTLSVSAPGFAGGERTLFVQSTQVFASPFSGPPYVGVGQELQVYFSVSPWRTKEQRVYLESSDEQIVRVDPYTVVEANSSVATRTTLRVVGTGTAYVRYWAEGTPVDSFEVSGTTPAFLSQTYTPTIDVGGTAVVTVFPRASTYEYTLFRTSAPLVVHATVDNPAVLELDYSTVTLGAGEEQASIPVRVIGQGTGNLIVTADGYLPDTIQITGAESWIGYSNPNSVGVNQLLQVSLDVGWQSTMNGNRTLTVTSSAPGVLEVMTPVVQANRMSPYVYVYLRGVSVGTAGVTVSGTDFTTQSFNVSVGATQLVMYAQSGMNADGLARQASVALLHGATSYPLADTVTAVLRSSDPDVLQVIDSTLVMAPGNYFADGGFYVPVGPGTATLWAVRPGVDSASYEVTVYPNELVVSYYESVVGQHMRGHISVYRAGPDSAEVPLTITQSGSGSVSFLGEPTSFEAGSPFVDFAVVGETVGEVVLTFSAPGFAPTEVLFTVESTNLHLLFGENPWTVGTRYPYAGNHFQVSGGFGAAPGKDLRLLLTSLDTSKIEVVADTILWSADYAEAPSRYASLLFKREGIGTLVITDLDGVLGSDTTQVTIYPGQLWGYAGTGNALALGMGQHSFQGELLVLRESLSSDALWVYLTSSDPTIVHVPDSVQIPAMNVAAYFQVTAADTTGSARVTASAPGFNPWTFDVLVTAARFEMYGFEAFTDGGGALELYGVDGVQGFVHPFNTDLPVRFSTNRPDLLDVADATTTIPAGVPSIEIRTPRGLAPGVTSLRAEDDRGERFDKVHPGHASIDISEARLSVDAPRLLLTPGLRSVSFDHRINAYTGQDSIWVHFAAVGDRFAPGTDSLKVGQYSYGCLQSDLHVSDEFPLIGLGFGTDTLIVSSAGLRPDTVVVSVAPGSLRLVGAAAPIFVGDSLLVRVQLLDAAGNYAFAAENLELAYSLSSQFTLRVGGQQAGVIPVETNDSEISFWVRAESAGSGSLVVSDPRFDTFVLNLNAVERP